MYSIIQSGTKKMGKVMTVLGSISGEQLGCCQCHEHLLIRRGISYEVNPALCMEDLGKSAKEVEAFKKSGGNTIVDAQPGGCNRMEEGLREISLQTGVNIISSTGFHKLMFYPRDHWIRRMSGEGLYQFFMEELQMGMYTDCDTHFPTKQTDIRAGIVKAALDEQGLTSDYQRLFDAAAKAARDAKVPLMVHIERGSNPEELLHVLLNQGVDKNKIIFCHMDRAIEEMSYYTSVLTYGVTLEFDTIGRFHYHDDALEIGIIKKLLDKGYEKQLLLSLDTTRERLKSYTPAAVGLDYLLRVFLPELRGQGVTQEQIHTITVKNAMNIFM